MKPLFLDIETYYGDGYSLSLKDVTTESYVRDERFKIHGLGIAVGDSPAKWITGRLVPELIKRIDWPNTIMVGHNLQFDGFILSHHFGVAPKYYLDTLAMSRAFVGPHSAKHGLKYVAELLCGMTKMDELAKAYNRRDLPPDIEKAIADYTVGEPRFNLQKNLYEAGDIILTREIFKKMAPLLKAQTIKEIDWVTRAFTQPLLNMDEELLETYIDELAERKREVLVSCGLDNRDLLMSNDRYAEALENLGVFPPTKISAKTGKVSYAFAKTDEAHIALLDHPNSDVQALVAARLEHKSTIEETRSKLYLEAARRGAWPVGYNYAGAYVTQRLSGNKGAGGNPQNLKRGGTLRNCIYAPEGYELGVADLSQIEARITLWLGMQLAGPDSEEARALKVMDEGQDIYSWFGSKIYGYEISKETHPNERQIAKSAVLGLGYGMGYERFIDYCKTMGIKGVDKQFAKEIVQLYRSTFKGVVAFWKECNKAVTAMISGQYGAELPSSGHVICETGLDPLLKQSCIYRPNGMTIKYPDLLKDVETGELTYRDGNKRVKLFGGKICENIVQAIAADILRVQLTNADTRYRKDKPSDTVRVVMTTHDELVCLIPKVIADTKVYSPEKKKMVVTVKGKFRDYIERVMKQPIEYLPGLPLDVEVGTDSRYGQAK